jgi:hypothetical protein
MSLKHCDADGLYPSIKASNIIDIMKLLNILNVDMIQRVCKPLHTPILPHF